MDPPSDPEDATDPSPIYRSPHDQEIANFAERRRCRRPSESKHQFLTKSNFLNDFFYLTILKSHPIGLFCMDQQFKFIFFRSGPKKYNFSTSRSYRFIKNSKTLANSKTLTSFIPPTTATISDSLVSSRVKASRSNSTSGYRVSYAALESSLDQCKYESAFNTFRNSDFSSSIFFSQFFHRIFLTDPDPDFCDQNAVGSFFGKMYKEIT